MEPKMRWQEGHNPCSGQVWTYPEARACVQEFLALDESPRGYDFLPGFVIAPHNDVITEDDTTRVASIDHHLKRYRANQIDIQAASIQIGPVLRRLSADATLATLTLDAEDQASMATWRTLAHVFAVVTNVSGWGGSGGRAALLLHLKRPHLVPLLMQSVREYLARTLSYNDPQTHRFVDRILAELPAPYSRSLLESLLRLTIAYRTDLYPNREVFDQLRTDLPEPYSTLSAVRLLDILIWGYASGNQPVWRSHAYARDFQSATHTSLEMVPDDAPASAGRAESPNEEKAILSLEEVAAYLDVPPALIEELLTRRALHGIRLGSLWRIRRTDLDAFLDKGGDAGDHTSTG